jgi:hypothetical protein
VSQSVLVAANGGPDMFGRKSWKSGEAKVLAVNIIRVTPDGVTPTREFAADISVPGVDPFRAKLGEARFTADFWPPSVGEVRGVLFDPASHAVKFDMKDKRNSFKHHTAASASGFDALLNEKRAD